MEIIEITENKILFREIFHFFRDKLLVISGVNTNHRRVRAENEIKAGLKFQKVKRSHERHSSPKATTERMFFVLGVLEETDPVL